MSEKETRPARYDQEIDARIQARERNYQIEMDKITNRKEHLVRERSKLQGRINELKGKREPIDIFKFYQSYLVKYFFYYFHP